jgi:Protein of unknown function (DUF3631)
MTPVDNDRPQLYGVPVVPVVSDDEPRGVPPDEVAALLNDIRRVVARYIVLDEQQLDTIALWVMHTFIYREFYTTPYLAIMSPTMRSGKSNLLTVLEAICHDPEIVVHSSTAGLYRTIDELRPTLLFDELDMAQMSKTYRGILHSGYKAGASVTLSVGGKPKRLSTFCPKAYASIGRALTPTLIDRSIQIHMRRKLPTETVAEFSIAGLAAVTEGLRDRLANFRADFIVPDDMPPRPEVLNDREREIWLPLFTIAAQATGWDTRCRNAAVQLTAASRQEEPDESVLLLADIRDAFGGKNKLFSEELLKGIRNLEDPQYSGPATHSTKALAIALAPHRIFPRQLRIGRETKKGYLRVWFADAFARYVPQSETTETSET